MVSELERFLGEATSASYGRDAFDKYCRKRGLSLNVPTIHVAGSNGKGSFCHYLESVYLAAGYKVAAFIKPAFYEVNECIRFNGKNISDEELQALFEESERDLRKFGLTAFEATVVLAYRYFESKKPDLVIVEAGMGGAIDATNIDEMNTILSVITSISLEHTSYLGTTLSQIALHKAGILKPNTPVLVGQMDDDPLAILREAAEEQGGALTVVDKDHFATLENGHQRFDYGPFKAVELSTPAQYQIKNACLAIETTRLLQDSFPVKEEDLRAGLKVAPLPGRYEKRGNVLFDGAHNPEGVKALVDSLREDKPIHVLFASFRDKNIAVELPALGNAVASIALTSFDHPRARQQDDYMLYLGDFPFYEDALEGLRDLLQQYPEDIILVTGSLAFVGYLRDRAEKEGVF